MAWIRSEQKRLSFAVLWDAPPRDLIEVWVAEYGQVAKSTVLGASFYTRPLKRGERNAALSLSTVNPARAEEHICQLATLWPLDYDFSAGFQPAGVPTRLAKEILEASAFSPGASEALFNAWRARVTEQEIRRDLLILGTFRGLTYEHLDGMTQDRYYQYLAAAEFLEQAQIFTSGDHPEYNPEEFTDLLIMPQQQLFARVQQADKDRQWLAQQQAQQEAQQQGGGQQQSPFAQRPRTSEALGVYVAPPPTVNRR